MKKSISEKVYNKIKRRKVGGIVNTKKVAAMVGCTTNQASAALSNMRMRGYLTSSPGTGNWKIVRDLSKYGDRLHHGAIKSAPKVRQPRKHGDEVRPAYQGDVIDNLLEAMAAAEPELRRLRDLEKGINTLVGKK